MRLRAGYVPEEFLALVDRTETPMEQWGDQERLGSLKAELAEKLWGESLDELFHVTVFSHQAEKSGHPCTS